MGLNIGPVTVNPGVYVWQAYLKHVGFPWSLTNLPHLRSPDFPFN